MTLYIVKQAIRPVFTPEAIWHQTGQLFLTCTEENAPDYELFIGPEVVAIRRYRAISESCAGWQISRLSCEIRRSEEGCIRRLWWRVNDGGVCCHSPIPILSPMLSITCRAFLESTLVGSSKFTDARIIIPRSASNPTLNIYI